MADHEAPTADDGARDALAELGRKLDTIAGALAAVAGSHTDLLAHVAEAEARRSHDSREVSQRLVAIERQILALPSPPSLPPADPLDPFPASGSAADLEQLRADVALTLEEIRLITDGVQRLDARTEDRLAAVRDAATAPVADLQELLSARGERQDAQLAELVDAVRAAATPAATSDTTDAVMERVEELAGAVHAITWRLPELGQELAALRAQVEGIDVAGPLADVTHELSGRLTLHTDTALAGALRVIDDRLAALRNALSAGAPAGVGGFEAGAVMGAAQAAWNRLEQRLDAEFDDLGRQLQAMAALIEQTAASTEAVANRPVVTGDQLRRAAASVKDSVVGANRSRRDRRGGPRGLGSGR